MRDEKRMQTAGEVELQTLREGGGKRKMAPVKIASIKPDRRVRGRREFQLRPRRDDIPLMKILLSVGLYVSLVFVLAYVMASLAPREGLNEERGDDEF
jgi:hypothetical protein